MELGEGDNLLQIEHIENAPISPPSAIAAVALNFALKYHDINTIQDGALYQQYKLEGRNMRDLQLDAVFETAMRIERHILAAPGRLTEAFVEVLADALEEGAEDTPESEETKSD